MFDNCLTEAANPGGHELKMDRKNINSRAYKKKQQECQKLGMDHEKCIEEARKAGRAAVKEAIEKGILRGSQGRRLDGCVYIHVGMHGGFCENKAV